MPGPPQGILVNVKARDLTESLDASRVRASMLTIHVGHIIHYILYALVDGLKSTQRNVAQLKHEYGTLEDNKHETANHFHIHGYLENSGVWVWQFKELLGCGEAKGRSSDDGRRFYSK